MTDWDVIVIGAGPAGAMSAIEARRRGLSVLVVERSVWPRFKVCGSCIGAGALDVLAAARLGSLAEEAGAVPLDTLRLYGRGTRADISLPGSRALSRRRLDAALVDVAVAEGAVFRPEARARLGPVEGDRRTVLLGGSTGTPGSEVLRARVIVTASGLLGETGSEPSAAEPGSRVGLGASFHTADDAYEAGSIHMAVGRTGYVGLVRVEDGSLQVAAAVDAGQLRTDSPADVVRALLTEAGLPPLEGAVAEAWRGTPALTRAPLRRAGERLFVVGDAAGYVEPFTGEGMKWALAGACALAPFVERGVAAWSDDLESAWEAEHRRSIGTTQWMCRGVAAGLRRPRVAHAAIQLLERIPAAAAPFVRFVSTAPIGSGGTQR